MKNIEIDRPKKTEKEAIQSFFSLVIKDTYIQEGIGNQVDDINNEINSKMSYLKSDFDSDGQERFFLIAKYQGQIVGTVEIGPPNEHIVEGAKGKLDQYPEIGTVFVHPDYQNRGISTILMHEILLVLRDRGIKEFCLDSGYTIAKKIWQKKLGEPEYILKDFWGDGYDHNIWFKKVDEALKIFDKI